MESKLLTIFQLCLEMGNEGKYDALYSYGSSSKTISVSVYKKGLRKEDILYNGRVFLTLPNADIEAEQMIKQLETFKTLVYA